MDFCDNATAKGLYDIGYDFPKRLMVDYFGVYDTIEYDDRIHLFDAQKFLRKRLNVIVEVFVDDDSDRPVTYNVHKDNECVCHHHGNYYSIDEWDDALLEGIRTAIKIIRGEYERD